MSYITHKKLAEVGGALIFFSGIINALLGVKIGALLYEVYPGGNFGHVGILAGIGVILIGLIIIFGIVRIYESKNRWYILLGGFLTIVVGYIGGIAGAIYVGTVGVPFKRRTYSSCAFSETVITRQSRRIFGISGVLFCINKYRLLT
ncbi:MAG: hypothetical protein WBH40_18335 [Ignavibacteriaceae bacterium]